MFFNVNYKPSNDNKNEKIKSLDQFDPNTETFKLWTILTEECEKACGTVLGSWALITSSSITLPIDAMRDMKIDGKLDHSLYSVCLYIENIEGREPCIHMYAYEQSSITFQKGILMLPSFAKPKNHFILYDGRILMKSLAYSFPKKHYQTYPCTLADLYTYIAGTSMHYIFSVLMNYWSKTHLIWKDILKDYQNPKAYGAIPIKDVWSSYSVRDLINRQYGYDAKRINKDGLGRSVFIAKVRRYVKENELQLLYGYDPPQTRLGKKKQDITYAMADYLWKKSGCSVIHSYKVQTRTVRVRGEDRAIFLNKKEVEDTISVILDLRELIPLQITTPKALQKLHDDVHLRKALKGARVVIDKDNPFRKLKLPSEYHIIESKRDLIEEGQYQHNCVGSYAQEISDGNCCIVSKREPDGERYTIEIRINSNKEFVIEQYKCELPEKLTLDQPLLLRRNFSTKIGHNLIKGAITGCKCI